MSNGMSSSHLVLATARERSSFYVKRVLRLEAAVRSDPRVVESSGRGCVHARCMFYVKTTKESERKNEAEGEREGRENRIDRIHLDARALSLLCLLSRNERDETIRVFKRRESFQIVRRNSYLDSDAPAPLFRAKFLREITREGEGIFEGG